MNYWRHTYIIKQSISVLISLDCTVMSFWWSKPVLQYWLNKCYDKRLIMWNEVHKSPPCFNFKRKRERHVLFNDALNTFYLRLYGVRHMVKDHSDSEKGNLLPPHRLQQGFFYMHHPTDRITHTTAFVTPVVEHWLEREIAQWVRPILKS